eukprot:scaffold3667_cov180-Amphora_coffeaeformis.AAC.10
MAVCSLVGSITHPPTPQQPFVGTIYPMSTTNGHPPRTVSIGSFENEGQKHADSNASVLDGFASNYSTGWGGHEHHDGISSSSLVSFQSEECRTTSTLFPPSESTAPDVVPQGIFSSENSMETSGVRRENVPLDGGDDGTVSNIMDEFAEDWALPFDTEQLVEDDACLGSLLNGALDESIGCGPVPI